MLWNYNNSLTDIQHILISLFSDKMRLRVKASDILQLNTEEYNILVDRVKLIQSPDDMQYYCLSAFVGWYNSYIQGTNKEYYRLMKGIILNMPQHHTKYVMESINTNCFDFQIDTLGLNLSTANDIDKIAKYHAGF